MHVSGSPVSIISCYNNDIISRKNYTPVMSWQGCYRQIFLPSTSASAAMIILLYFRLSRLKSFPYPCEKPQPSAFTMALISSLERTRSVVCFSTFRIFSLSNISIGPDYLLLSAAANRFKEHSVSDYVPIITLLPVSPGIVDTREYSLNSHGINFTRHTLARMHRGQPSPLAALRPLW